MSRIFPQFWKLWYEISRFANWQMNPETVFVRTTGSSTNYCSVFFFSKLTHPDFVSVSDSPVLLLLLRVGQVAGSELAESGFGLRPAEGVDVGDAAREAEAAFGRRTLAPRARLVLALGRWTLGCKISSNSQS